MTSLPGTPPDVTTPGHAPVGTARSDTAGTGPAERPEPARGEPSPPEGSRTGKEPNRSGETRAGRRRGDTNSPGETRSRLRGTRTCLRGTRSRLREPEPGRQLQRDPNRGQPNFSGETRPRGKPSPPEGSRTAPDKPKPVPSYPNGTVPSVKDPTPSGATPPGTVRTRTEPPAKNSSRTTRTHSAPRMPPPCRPPSPLRCVQALSALLALVLAAAPGYWNAGEGDGCLSAWALSFVFTLLLLLNDAFRRPPPRRDLPLALATAAAMACATATVLWPLGHLRGHEGGQGRPRALRAAATAASAVATLAYAAEVTRDRARPGEAAPYLATPSGLLKVAEAFLALLLLGLSAELGAASGPAALRWCLGIFCVSFVLGVLLVGGCLLGWGWCGWMRDPEGLRWGLGVYAGLGVVAYGAATVLWALYSFSDDMGGQSRRPYGCPATCSWDRRVLVAVLSGLNLVAFGVDLGQTGRLVLLRA